MQFVKKYDGESAGQHIPPGTLCQISYPKSTVTLILSPIVPYKCCVMTADQLWSLMDKWISNSHGAMCVLCVCVCVCIRT